jgi:branched-chain amino acid transport system ATP-binding protein
MKNVLSVRNLKAGYGGTAVIRGVDLEVNEGEIVALLGPNGAGKSTTLLASAGVLPAMDGQILFLGEKVPGLRPHLVARRGLALVCEQRALFTQMTVRENLRLGATKYGATTAEILGYFPELEPRLDIRAGLLSGGEQQMLALGRALIGRPKLLLIDEMSLGLAPMIVKRLLDFLETVTSSLGASVMLVEQQVESALKISSRAYVLNHGAVVMSGRSSDFLKERAELNKSYFGTSGSAERRSDDR